MKTALVSHLFKNFSFLARMLLVSFGRVLRISLFQRIVFAWLKILLLTVLLASVNPLCALTGGSLSPDPNGGTALNSNDRSVVVLIHGWTQNDATDNAFGSGDLLNLVNALHTQLLWSEWKLLLFHWEADAATGKIFDPTEIPPYVGYYNASNAASNALSDGTNLANLLNVNPNLRKVVFVAHSAGAWAAYQAAYQLLQMNPYVVINVVLLDPFIPGVPGSPPTALTTAVMDQLSTNASANRIYRLENYYSFDVTDLNIGFGANATSQTFAWRNSDINGVPRTDISTHNLDYQSALGLYYSESAADPPPAGHFGPVRFYTDTVVASSGVAMPDGLTQAPWNAPSAGFYRGLINESYLLPQITTQPQSQSAPTGATIVLSVTTQNTTTYQWYKDGVMIQGTASTLTLTNISSSNAGDYVVRVGNNNNSGLAAIYSDAAHLSVNTVPAVPSNLSAIATSSSHINLSWVENAQDVTGFTVQRQTGSSGAWTVIAILSPNAVSYSDPTVLTPSTTYSYEICANNSAGSSAFSNVASATTPSAGSIVPAPPTGLVASVASSSQINLSWNEVSSNQTGFIVLRSPSGIIGSFSPIFNTSQPINVAAYFDTGLSPDTRYYYQVFAVGSTDSSVSNTATAITLPGATSVQVLTVNSSNPSTGVHVYLGPNDLNGLADGNSSFIRQFTSNTDVTLIAPVVASNGNTFQKWQEDGQDLSTSAQTEVVMNNPHTLTAIYTTPVSGRFAISTSTSPTNGGSTTGANTYSSGATVTLIATPNNGYQFTNWTLNTNGGTVASTSSFYQFNADGNVNLVANFTATSGTQISTNILPANAGTVTGAGSYQFRQNLTLTETPASGYTFGSWTSNGSVVSFANPFIITVTGAQTYTANFNPTNAVSNGGPDLIPKNLTVTPQSGNAGNTVTIHAEINNQGDTNANPFQASVQVSSSSSSPAVTDPTLFTMQAPSGEGARNLPLISTTIPVQLPSNLSPGTYYIWINVDAANTAGEPSAFRGNNMLAVPFVILPPGLTSGVDLFPHDFAVTPASCIAGVTIDVKGGIKNGGNTGSSGFKYYVSISTSATVSPDKSALNSVNTVPALSADIDMSVDTSIALPSNLAPGNYYLWIMVDPENASGEPAGNTSNNNIVLPLTIIQPLQTFTISTNSSSQAGGNTTGNGLYVSGAWDALAATPASGYGFANWTENGTVVSTAANYNFTVNSSQTLVANFAALTPPIITSVNNADFTVGQVSSFTVTATGNPAPTFSANGLPSWVSLNSITGVLSGTPTNVTGASFSINLTATNSNSPDATQVFILNVQATLNQWEAQYFNVTQMSNSAISGPTATPQNDGIPNLLKYLYDINPTIPMSATDRVALPALGIDDTTTPGTEYLTLTYRENRLMTGITVHLQISSDLQTWTTMNSPDLFQQVGADSGDPIMEVGVKLTGAKKQFVRLNVTSQLVLAPLDDVPI